MKYKRKKATFGILAPNIQRGGMAIPLGNNLYWMKGRKHKTGGIDIGKDLEVENNEVMQMLPNETRVFSSVKMLGGSSPAELVAIGMNPNKVFNAQEAYKRINRINDDGSRYKRGGKAKLGKRIKVKTDDGDRDIYYDDKQQRWVWGKNKVALPYGHRIKFSDGYEYQLNSDGTQTRIGKKPTAAEQAITAPMKYTPNNDVPTAALDVLTAPLADDDKLYYNGILPLHNPSIYKNAPLYAYRTGDMSYLRNDDSSIYTPTRRARQDLPRKLYEFYNQDTIYMPSSLIENVDKLKQGIIINQENVDPSYVYGPNNKIAIDARNHNMQIRDLGNNNYVADFSDIFDTNKEFFDSKANPMIFSQLGVPIVFTDDATKINQSFINEVNNALVKKYGGKMNLQNIDNPLARDSKRMISPNKLGTIVRVDGNGRDRLAYIPSTGSSKQDMKCGGRAKAPFGSSLSRLNSMLSKIDMDALSDAWDRVEEMEDEKYKNVKSNMIQLDDGTLIKESLPELDVSPKRDLFKFPTLNITSAPNTELRRPDFKIGNPIIPDDVKNEIKGLGDYNDYHWIKSGTDLLTTGLSTFNNLYYLNRMKEPPRPAVNPGVKLKTRWNNNATLSAIRESLANTIIDLTRNTASSQNLRNSINQARVNAIGLINKSNEDRENKETELINTDLRQRATTIKDNIDNYNTWRNSLAAFRNNIFDKRSETWNNMMSNVNKVVNEAIENREQRDAERRQFDFLSYAYPIVRNNSAISNYLYNILFGKNKQSKS